MELYREAHKGLLDPRTKLALVLTCAIYILGNAGGSRMQMPVLILSTVPFILNLLDGSKRTALAYLLIMLTTQCICNVFSGVKAGNITFLVFGISGFIRRLAPGLFMARYLLTTTTVSEFIAAMQRMKVPDAFTIPLAVVFRFFPTITEEYAAINHAMGMRGVRPAGGKFAKILEYRIVPMMSCSLKIGEELSAAALTRGLGAPIKRTNICRIGFHALDYVLLTACGGMIIYHIAGGIL